MPLIERVAQELMADIINMVWKLVPGRQRAKKESIAIEDPAPFLRLRRQNWARDGAFEENPDGAQTDRLGEGGMALNSPGRV